MEIKYIFFLLLPFFLFLKCNKNTTEPQDGFTIQGTILYKNSTLANASVTINNDVNFTTISDVSGNFVISNVPAGEHTLKMSKSFADGTFVERENNLLVDADIILNSLKLPKAIFLNDPFSVTSKSISLSWSATDADDFREYKIFRHINSGLDEATGELIHISTSVQDTIFTDTGLNALSDYYYRTYVMNDFGRLGGSNIVSVSTLNRNLFPDGGFEESSVLSDNWTVNFLPASSSAQIDDSLSYEGNNSLHLILPVSITHNLMSSVVADDIYELSFWYRVFGDSIKYGQPDDRSINLSHFGGGNTFFDMFDMTSISVDNPDEPFDTGWQFYFNNVSMKEDRPVVFGMGLGSSTNIHMLFDNFILKKIDLESN